jgi:hypothetical protein
MIGFFHYLVKEVIKNEKKTIASTVLLLLFSGFIVFSSRVDTLPNANGGCCDDICVKKQNGNPVPNCTVTVEYGGEQYQCTTNSNGVCSMCTPATNGQTINVISVSCYPSWPGGSYLACSDFVCYMITVPD